MKNIIFILLIFLLFYIFLYKSDEKFDIVSNNVYKDFEESYTSIKDNNKIKDINLQNNNLIMEEVPNINCCLIEKNM
jgi:hypothetical protein